MPLDLKDLAAALERGDPITSIPALYPRKPYNGPQIAPLSGYKPQPVIEDLRMSLGQMADITRRDSPNFGKWMKQSGGFHYDDTLKKFVSD